MIVNFFSVLLAAILLTALIRLYALKQKVLDIPNQRSSHTIPTPRGGGLAIVTTFSLAIVSLFFNAQLDLHKFVILFSCLLVAGIGFWDDHTHIPAKWRFLVHFLTSFIAVYFLQGFPAVIVGKWQLELGIVGFFVGIVFLVWWLNLFNFMDGTDGIAASEAIFVAASIAGFIRTTDPQLFQIALLVTAATGGFLCWNWPPAKIFMGDVGSGFLGLVLGLLVLMSAHQNPCFLFVGMILFGFFFVDASYTLVYRFASGQKWYDAHCSHAYQQAAKQYGHLKVLIGLWLINLFWLLPVALWVYFHPTSSIEGLLIAYCPLIFLAYRFKAGSQLLIQ